MTRTEFLSKLADEARGSLSPELTQALVSEVAGHLDESIQSRLELGEPPELAEINAIAAFAVPESFVHQMETVHEGVRTHDRVLFAVGMGFVLLLAFWVWIAMFQLISNLVWILILLGTLVGFFARSYVLGSPRWRTLLSLVVASIVLIGGLQPFLQVNLWDYGGMGYIPAGTVQQYIDLQRAQMGHPINGWTVDKSLFDMNIEAAERANVAPLTERWQKSFGPSGGLMVLSIAMLIFAHLFPVALRRRLRRSRLRRA